MGASSQSNAGAQKNLGPTGANKPGGNAVDCPLANPPVLLAQTVTPTLTVNEPQRKFFAKAAPDRDEIGSVTLKAAVSGDALGYKEAGVLSANNADCTFYSDRQCKKKIDPAAGPVKYKYGSLESGVTVYFKGANTGSTQLTLTMDGAKDGRINVLPPAAGTAAVTQVLNHVVPDIVIDKTELPCAFPELDAIPAEIHLFQPKAAEKKPVPVAKVTVKCTADISVDAYDKSATVSVDNANVALWLDAACKKPAAAPLTVSNVDIRRGFSFWLSGKTAGDTVVSLTLADTTKDRAEVDTSAKTATVKVQAVSRVTPYLQVEHLVVLLDPKLEALQRKNDTATGSAAADAAEHIHADVTRIELSAKESAKAPAYAGQAQLVLTPAGARVFEDEACTKPFDLATKVDFGKLIGVKPLELFLRGDVAGKFTAELKLDDSADALVMVDTSASGELGCAKLEFKLHHYLKADVDHAIDPDVDEFKTYWKQLKALEFKQKEMTDAERVGTGRMLHLQDKNLSHARAKLELVCDPAHWPAAAKDYKVIVDLADAAKAAKTRSGSVKLFSKEEKGDEIKLPQSLTTKAASTHKPLWVEGAAICDKWRDIRLSVGFDRPDGGPAKVRKMDGNWCTFTIVKIKEVKCDLDNEAGEEQFVDGKKLFINLDANGRVLKTVAGKRKADVTATIEPVLQDVDVHFLVVEHENNFKDKDFPKKYREGKLSKFKHTLKAVDRVDRKQLLTMSAKTDDKGVAKIETLQVPQVGKLQFKVGAYLMTSPQLARYNEGDSTLKKKTPELSKDWYEVWRRLFYKVIAMNRWSGASYLDRFDAASIKSKLAVTGIEFEEKGAAIAAQPFDCALPNFLNWTRAAGGGIAPSRTLYLGLINGRGDKGDLDVEKGWQKPAGLNVNIDVPYIRLRSTADKTKWLKLCEYESKSGNVHDMAAHATLAQTDDFKYQLSLDFTALRTRTHQDARAREILAGADAADADQTADEEADAEVEGGNVFVTFLEADSSSGVSQAEAVIVCMDSREPDHAKQSAKDSATHTMLHEIGHYLGLGTKFEPDRDDTPNPNFYSELAGEVSQRGMGGKGMGPHCDGLKDKCIVWYQFKMTLEYCETCHMMLRSRAFHTPKIAGRDRF